MSPKTGTLVHKKGTLLHQTGKLGPTSDSEVDCAGIISAALKGDLGSSRGAVKIVMQWTGASERAVKYWFAGEKVPSGDHLIALARQSDAVFLAFLKISGREPRISVGDLSELRDSLRESVSSLDKAIQDSI